MLHEQAARLIDKFENSRFQIRFRELEDAAATGIQKVLDSQDYELVVMGSHGRRGLQRWLLGSVAETTVRYSECSVVVVHPVLSADTIERERK